jgi:hypothetical protein
MKRILESGRRGGVRARCETVGAMTHIDMYTALLHSHLSKAVARRVLGMPRSATEFGPRDYRGDIRYIRIGRSRCC